MFTAYLRYFDFQGRAGRGEYWLFVFTMVLAIIGAIVLDLTVFEPFPDMAETGVSGPAYAVVVLFHLIPALSLQVRRLHDTNRTGWWLLVSLIPLVGSLVMLIFSLLEGTRGPNRFGYPHGGRPPALNLESGGQAERSGGATPTNNLDRLEQLGKLRDQGVLSAAEFETQKARILAA